MGGKKDVGDLIDVNPKTGERWGEGKPKGNKEGGKEYLAVGQTLSFIT